MDYKEIGLIAPKLDSFMGWDSKHKYKHYTEWEAIMNVVESIENVFVSGKIPTHQIIITSSSCSLENMDYFKGKVLCSFETMELGKKGAVLKCIEYFIDNVCQNRNV